MNQAPGEVTQLLTAFKAGEGNVEGKLLDVVYKELHRVAARHMRRERADHTLQASALIHEAYEHLVDQRAKDWQNRAHFFAVASEIMRRILVDYARTRRTAKRGSGQPKVSLDDVPLFAPGRSDELVALDEALTRLAAFDPRQSKVVELRFFGDLTEDETAEVLGISSRTVKREWSVAKAWLYGELNK